MHIQGYQVSEMIYQTPTRTVYRGLRVSDQLPVIIKVPTKEYPSLRDISRYKHEYGILASLDLEGVIKVHALEKYQNGYAIIEEDFHGESLGQIISRRKLDLGQCLRVAISVAEGLANLHQHEIIHKDIKPSNLIVNEKTWDTKISDFGLSSMISREKQEIKNPELLEGTLAYISPEQTGRMNRSIDYRTDFYSLGVTFYEILTGQLPFKSTDAMELVHSHLAKTPVAPIDVDRSIPRNLSDIVMKLMAKTAEERYAGAYGLKLDLVKCFESYTRTGTILPFKLGEHDISNKFQISQKLYGRAKEIEILLETFQNVSKGGSELVLVNGYSGIGKSVLVQEVHKPIVARKGYFISGKFDQFQRGVPYSSFFQAFEQLINHILTESPQRVENWRRQLVEVLGPNGQVVTSVLPALSLIIGPQEPVPVIGPSETQKRFNLIFLKFISVFARDEHPLVLFLDDLQWADSASLMLLNLLITDQESGHLFLIGAYRDNEVGPSHPLSLTLEDIEKAGTRIKQIHLGPFSLNDLNELVADTLSRQPAITQELSQMLLARTDGNPFFLTEILKTLFEDGFFHFNMKTGQWEWELEEIEKMQISGNVVELMITKIKKLSPQMQNVLKLASAIGNTFSLELLAAIHNDSHGDTHNELWLAIKEGLVIRVGDSYKFLHDRVQQAAYALVPEDEKEALHLEIGWLILEDTPKREREEKIFDIVEHLIIGKALIKDKQERETTCRLCVTAGIKAKQSTAYLPAVGYFEAALDLAEDDPWAWDYDLTLALYTNYAECQAVTGNFETSEKTFNHAVENARCDLDKVAIYATQMPLFQIEGTRFGESVTIGLEAIKLMGRAFPRDKETIADRMVEETAELDDRLQNLNMEDLKHAPEIKDENLKILLDLLVEVWTAAYLSAEIELADLIAFYMTNLSLKHGNGNTSCFSYMVYASTIGNQGRYKDAYAWGQLAMHFSKTHPNPRLTGKIHNLYGHTMVPYNTHLKHNIEVYGTSIKDSYECGDVVWGVWSLVYSIWTRFMIGQSLGRVGQLAREYMVLARQTGDDNMVQVMGIQRHVMLNLQGRTADPLSLDTDELDEEKAIAALVANGFDVGANWYYTLKCQVLYFNGAYEAALQMAEASEKTIAANSGFFNITKHYFYYALTLAALYQDTSESEQEAHMTLLDRFLDMYAGWASGCPENFGHKYDLIRAEKARVLGADLEAMTFYDNAIEKARKFGFIQHEALANELAVHFYMARGRTRIAHVYIKDSVYGYTKWGAQRKAADLKLQYPELFAVEPLHRTSTSSASSSHYSGQFSSLDFTTAVKVAQSISGETALDGLLVRLMSYVLENAGAQRGFLLMERGDEFFIEAQGSAEGDGIVRDVIPLAESNELAVSVVLFVARTHKTVTLDEANQFGDFTDDPHIVSEQTKSLLCMPIIQKRAIKAILYLENNLAVGTFTEERCKVLQILGAQVAISIENVSVYQNLEQKVKERTLELERANKETEQTLENLKAAQVQLVQSEKMATLGQLIAGIAHEVNTPAGAIFAAINEVDDDYVVLLEQLIDITRQIDPVEHASFLAGCRRILAFKARERSTKEQRTIARTIQKQLQDKGIVEARGLSKDLALIGFENEHIEELIPLLAGTVGKQVHQSYRQLGITQIHVRDIKISIKRIVELVKSLKSYSRLDSSHLRETDLREDLENTIVIFHNKLKHGITIVKEYNEIPLVTTYAEQLNQIWTNLIHNAVQAMDGKGQICLRILDLGDNEVAVEIEDTGPGIPNDVMPRIFDSHFTTKTEGEGSGLGLSIVTRILNKVNGRIKVESRPGCTCFRVILPVTLKEVGS